MCFHESRGKLKHIHLFICQKTTLARPYLLVQEDCEWISLGDLNSLHFIVLQFSGTLKEIIITRESLSKIS